MDLRRGQQIAHRYRLDYLLGQGGMGVVWAATHDVTCKAVALKFLSPSDAADPQMRQRFLREARAACAVDHPNVVRIHDVLEHEGMPLMVMDLLQGESLASRLGREQKLPLEEAARILLPVLSAVGTAHAAGIVHRDLKPDNIFLTPDADGNTHVTVLDFGIAKVTAIDGQAAQTGGLTTTGAMLGTPYYMAPEQVFGEKDVDHRADVWALGVILFECLSGRRPTQADNIGQILKMVTTGRIPPLADVAPEVPADVAELTGRMMARDRDERIANLREVSAVLRRYTNAGARSFGDPVVTRAPSPSIPDPPRMEAFAETLDAVATGVTGSKQISTLTSTTRDALGARRSQRRTIAVAAAVALAASMSIGAWVTLRRNSPAAAPAATAPVAPSPLPAAPSARPVLTAQPTEVVSAAAEPTTSAHRTPPQPPKRRPIAKSSAAANAPPAPVQPPIGGVVDRPPF